MILFKIIPYHSLLGLDAAMRSLIISALFSLAVVGCSTEPVAEPVDTTPSSWELQATKDAERDERRRELATKKKQEAAKVARVERDRIEAEEAGKAWKAGEPERERQRSIRNKELAKNRAASGQRWADNNLASAAKSLAIGLSDPEWFVGGNLHNKTGKEWVHASRKNKLATACDWVTGSIEKKMQNSARQREYSIEKAKGKEAWLRWQLIQSNTVVAGLDAFYDTETTQNQQTALAVTLLMVGLGWIDR
jgi:hypothetical protein